MRYAMCGRFILTSPGKVLAEHFGLMTEPELSPRYNIGPTQEVANNKIGPRRQRQKTCLFEVGTCSILGKGHIHRAQPD